MEALARASITVKGVLHVGAHECEELPFYQRIGVAPNKCVWIDAVQSKVDQALARGVPNVFKAVVSDTDNATVTFHLTNNVQSSSILEFGTHEKNYSWVHVVGSTQETTTTLDTFFKEKGLDPTAYDFWNFDIQGAELMALKGASNALQYAKALYLEVNTEEVYKGCAQLGELDAFLGERGFTRVLTDITPHGWGDALYIRIPKLLQIPKLSLCIPTMNRFAFLEKNIPQYLENPYIDEIVITDETGTDVALIAEKFKNAKLKLFINSQRLGAFLNKEEAVRRATNEWVALIDSDNFAPLSYFEAWSHYISTHPISSSIVYAPSRTIPINDHMGFDYRSFIGKELTKHTYRSLTSTGIILDCIINTGNYIVNKSSYLSALDISYESIYKRNIGLDVKLKTYFQLNRGDVFVFPSNMEYYHIVHPDSLYTTTANDIPTYGHILDSLYTNFV